MNTEPKCQISIFFDADTCPNPGHFEVTAQAKNGKLDSIHLCDGHVSFHAWKCDGCGKWFDYEIAPIHVPDDAKMCSDCARVYA